eukprot:670191-Pleurochrysis_carterae.AAC.1
MCISLLFASFLFVSLASTLRFFPPSPPVSLHHRSPLSSSLFSVRCARPHRFSQELKSLPLNRAACVAKLLAQLLSRNALPLTTLKVVAWHDLGTRSVFFWQARCAVRGGSGRGGGN